MDKVGKMCFLIQLTKTRRLLLQLLCRCPVFELKDTYYDTIRISTEGIGHDHYTAYVRNVESWKGAIYLSMTDDIIPHIPQIKQLLRTHH